MEHGLEYITFYVQKAYSIFCGLFWTPANSRRAAFVKLAYSKQLSTGRMLLPQWILLYQLENENYETSRNIYQISISSFSTALKLNRRLNGCWAVQNFHQRGLGIPISNLASFTYIEFIMTNLYYNITFYTNGVYWYEFYLFFYSCVTQRCIACWPLNIKRT